MTLPWALRPLTPQPSTGSPGALATGNHYVFTAAAGSVAAVLPALSTITVDGDQLMIEKDFQDATGNGVTVSCAGADTFESGATSITLTTLGERMRLQAATIAGSRVWKVVDRALHPAAASTTYAPLRSVAPTVTMSGTAGVNRHNPVDATGAAVMLALPAQQVAGAMVSVEKLDATANSVSVSGNIRGMANSAITLVSQYEALLLQAKSDGSWWVVAGHKTKAWIDAEISSALASNSTVAAAAASAVSSAASAAQLVGSTDGRLARDSNAPADPEIVGGIRDQQGHVSWVAVRTDGGVPAASVQLLRPALGYNEGSVAENTGIAFAVRDTAGRASELAIGLDGRLPDYVVNRIGTRLGPTILSGFDAATKSRLDQKSAWGDSLTQSGQGGGDTWETTLQGLQGKPILNRGIGGQQSGTIAVRQGGIVLSLAAAVTIPADTSTVAVSLQSSVTPINTRTDSSNNTIACSLAGVAGTLTITAYTGTTGVITGTFAATTAVGSTTAAAAGTPLVMPFAASDREFCQILWTGRNDIAFGGLTTITGTIAATQAMVAYISGAVQYPRFLVVSVTLATNEGTNSDSTGLAGRANVLGINQQLQALYPNNYVDLLGELLTNGLAKAGFAPTTADTTALANGTLPPSLMATGDSLHFNLACRQSVIAPFIARQLALRGWN